MTATAEQILRVRRLTNEAGSLTYGDEDIQGFIESHPLTDPYGFGPDDPDGLYETNPDWTPTYDLNAAAADIWEEKASSLAGDYDFHADGASYSRSQAYEQAMKQARYFRAKRSHKTMNLQPSPKPPISADELDSDLSN